MSQPPSNELAFMECDVCRGKPGSPTLCVGCLHNRAAVTKLKDQAHKPSFVVADGGGTGENRFRTMKQGFSAWTLDIDEALQFARRRDAETFAAEDDEAWQILPVPTERSAAEPKPTGAGLIAGTILDSDKLFAAIDKQIAECTRAIEQGMFPQVLDDVREERRDLRSLRGHLRDVVVFATKHVPASALETRTVREALDEATARHPMTCSCNRCMTG